MPDQSNAANATTADDAPAAEAQDRPREVKMQPKAVMWVAFAAGMLALVMFSLLFLHTAARNSWGPFGG